MYTFTPLILLTQVAYSLALPVADSPCPDEFDNRLAAVERFHAPRIQDPPPAADIPGVIPIPSRAPGGLPVLQIGDGQIQAHTTLPPGVPMPPFFNLGSPTAPPVVSSQQSPANAPPTTDVPALPPATDSLRTRTTTSTILRSTAVIVTVSPVLPNKSLTSLTTSAVQSPSQPVETNTSGSLHTTLETSAKAPILSLAPSLIATTSLLSLINTNTVSVTPTASIEVSSIAQDDIFRAIATDPPPAQIPQRGDHPVPRLNIQPQQRKLQTNKFYSNFFLGSQSQQTWTFPYSVAWSAGGGPLKSYGMAIAHTERSQVASGPIRQDTGAWSYYTNPIGVQSIIVSAAQLGTGTVLTTDTLAASSVNVNLQPLGASKPMITFPLVQGMGFISAVYNGATPLIGSGVGIKRVTYSGNTTETSGHKYRLTLSDGITWLVYIFPNDPTYGATNFTLLGSGNYVQGPSGFSGLLQVAKLPQNDSGAAESLYDDAAGTYPVATTISGSALGTAGSYTFSWSKQGDKSRQLMMFALPHHQQSFSEATRKQLTTVQLMTTTKGAATAVLADSWTLLEPNLPVTMNLAPWSPERGSVANVSPLAQAMIVQAGLAELAQDMNKQTRMDSMYYSGKALAKFAAVIYAVHDMGNNVSLALTGLDKLKAAFAVFVYNQQPIPLAYDTAWGGVVSSGSYASGNAGLDFGNSFYSDHHFHYGYFVYAAAVIGYLDPTWLQSGTNKAWVNSLLRDYANPINSDPYFPFSRAFDWYHGHSWAKGLFESVDGKDQESSSEDTMASYAMKIWGRVIGDLAMEARGNLMLAVQARSFPNYYLYTTDNTVEPPQFIANKVAGILFENKIDHTTYFGGLTEEIEGIHMIPLMPFSTLARRAPFVQQEWETYFSTYVNQVQGGWRGILMANLAIIDPVSSFNFFANYSGSFQASMLDGGASQTWYLAWSAALGGSLGVQARDGRDLAARTVPAHENSNNWLTSIFRMVSRMI